MSGPAVSIVVLTHDGREHLATCLASLAQDGWPSGDVEVVVVDNGSTDGTASFVREEFPSVRLQTAGRNLGFAPGVRFGALACRGETLVLLNNDTKVEKGWLSALVSALDGAPADVAAVTGRIDSWDGTKVDYRDTLLAFDGHAFQKDFGRPLADVRDDLPGAARLAPCGGNMAMRKETFLAQGGFDDDLRTALLPAVLLTFLHRTERILRETAPGGDVLTIDPYRDGGRPSGLTTGPRGLRRRAVRAVARLLRVPVPECGPDLAGEHSLSNLRALHRIAVDLPRLEEKRRENERLRTVPTRVLFARFPPVIVPTYPGDEELFSSDAFASLLPPGLELPRLALSTVMACPGR